MPGIVADVRKVAELPDPVGEVLLDSTLDNGLHLIKRRTPLGVLGTIYESRPNVTVDISTLALKTGNAVILRGGSDVLHSNIALTEILQRVLARHDFLPLMPCSTLTAPIVVMSARCCGCMNPST